MSDKCNYIPGYRIKWQLGLGSSSVSLRGCWRSPMHGCMIIYDCIPLNRVVASPRENTVTARHGREKYSKL